MPDLTTIAAALGSLKSATEIAKFISNSGVTLENAEIKLKFAELVGALADAKLEIAEIQTHLINKDEEIRKLKSKLELEDNLVYENRCYWKIKGEGRDGPFCQRCYDVDSILVRLQPGHTIHKGQTHRWHYCEACNISYDE
ncbi:MAG: hypothetical protein V3U75_00765 [Methylococcaceae bacterium]